MMNKTIVRGSIWAIFATALPLVGCGKQEGAAGGAPPGGMGTAVTAVNATSKDVPVYIDEIGKVTASEVVTVQPQVSGKIIARHFVDGADVKQGELLFEIDPRPFQATLEQAEGQLAKDKAQKTSMDWNVGQDTAALATKAISEQQLHNDTASRDQAAAAIAVDQATIDYAKLNIEYCSIKAPIGGRAGARLVDVGNVVNASGQAMGTNLLSIQKVNPIYADFTVNEAQLPMVRQYMAGGELQTRVMLPDENPDIVLPAPDPGMLASQPPATQPSPATQPTAGTQPAMQATAATKPAGPHLGKLIFLDNTVQDGSGTVKLRAELSNEDQHFWPGQFVLVRLQLHVKQGAVLVPVQCTQVSQTGLYVYVVKDGKADMRPVTLGQRQGEMVVVETGLAGGEQVVMTGQQMVFPGAPVTVVPPANGGPPGASPAAPRDVKEPKDAKNAKASARATISPEQTSTEGSPA